MPFLQPRRPGEILWGASKTAGELNVTPEMDKQMGSVTQAYEYLLTAIKHKDPMRAQDGTRQLKERTEGLYTMIRSHYESLTSPQRRLVEQEEKAEKDLPPWKRKKPQYGAQTKVKPKGPPRPAPEMPKDE
jgi:hypothetical protein